MRFKQLVSHIKRDGCRVRVYNRHTVDSAGGYFSADCAGGPLICLARLGMDEASLNSYLLHEYAHFLQWRSGYMERIDSYCDSNELYYGYIRGKRQLSRKEMGIVLSCMLAIEVDAEMTAAELAAQLNVAPFDFGSHWRSTRAYADSLKYGILRRREIKLGQLECVQKETPATLDELLAPLSNERMELYDSLLSSTSGSSGLSGVSL